MCLTSESSSEFAVMVREGSKKPAKREKVRRARAVPGGAAALGAHQVGLEAGGAQQQRLCGSRVRGECFGQ